MKIPWEFPRNRICCSSQREILLGFSVSFTSHIVRVKVNADKSSNKHKKLHFRLLEHWKVWFSIHEHCTFIQEFASIVHSSERWKISLFSLASLRSEIPRKLNKRLMKIKRSLTWRQSCATMLFKNISKRAQRKAIFCLTTQLNWLVDRLSFSLLTLAKNFFWLLNLNCNFLSRT